MKNRLVLIAALAALVLCAGLVCCDEERIITRGEAKRRGLTTEKPSPAPKPEPKIKPKSTPKSDREPEESTGPKIELTREQREELIRDFFEDQGIDISSNFDGYDLYEPDVLAKMQQALECKQDFVKHYQLNSEINSMIHEAATKRVVKVEPPMELADEATLQALELIVPNSESQPFLEMAKKDLREFYLEQPEHGKELLERLEGLLDSDHLHTFDAITQLEAFYHQWAPLGRLAKHIETHGQS